MNKLYTGIVIVFLIICIIVSCKSGPAPAKSGLGETQQEIIAKEAIIDTEPELSDPEPLKPETIVSEAETYELEKEQIISELLPALQERLAAEVEQTVEQASEQAIEQIAEPVLLTEPLQPTDLMPEPALVQAEPQPAPITLPLVPLELPPVPQQVQPAPAIVTPQPVAQQSPPPRQPSAPATQPQPPAPAAPQPAKPPSPAPVPAAPPVTPAPAVSRDSETPAARPAEKEPPAEDEQIVFSRIVRATVGQLVEIPFRGTGWVYLGELSAQRGITYQSRRLDPEGQTFILKIGAQGTYVLKFYKQDFIRNYIINDYVQVIAGLPPETAGSGWFNPMIDRGRVVAEPRWPTSPEEAELARNGGRLKPRDAQEKSSELNAASAESKAVQNQTEPAKQQVSEQRQPAQSSQTQSSQTQAGKEPSLPEQARPAESGSSGQQPQPAGNTVTQAAGLGRTSPPDAFLKKAREEFDEGKTASALAVLNQFMEYYPAGSDEAYWLLGQFYEANSPSRDILKSLDYYKRLLKEYPQSSRYNDARRRIAYLERFYINIQ